MIDPPGRLQSLGRAGLPRGADRVMAVGLAAVALVDLWLLHLTPELSAHPVTAMPFVVLVPACLGVRRDRPVAAAAAASVAVVLQGLLVTPTTSLVQVVTLLVLALSLGAHARGRRALAGLAACLVAVGSVAVGSSDSVGNVLTIVPFLGVPFAAGVAIRTARGYGRRLEQLAAELRIERKRTASLAVYEERTRIARELHDVVAHGMGVMTIQAAGGRTVFDQDPARAKQALASIESTGRTGLLDLERMVSLLRAPGDETSPAGAAHGLQDVPALVQRLRSGGLDLVLTDADERPPIPPALDQALFRILQEALTNVVKHAPGTVARAAILAADGMIEIDVSNGPPGPGGPPLGGGHGLLGMRERASLFGGTVVAGPSDDGGFLVRARVPVPGAVR